jgi:hypothetical protein
MNAQFRVQNPLKLLSNALKGRHGHVVQIVWGMGVFRHYTWS